MSQPRWPSEVSGANRLASGQECLTPTAAPSAADAPVLTGWPAGACSSPYRRAAAYVEPDYDAPQREREKRRYKERVIEDITNARPQPVEVIALSSYRNISTP